jgi:uncharacterized LabA/DUF88 family protein
MVAEPTIKRTVAFFDGQNLFHAAREAFGYNYPNYEPQRLASHVCSARSWNLHNTYFYTGVPEITDDANWNRFWAAKLLAMSRSGVQVFSRSLRYRNRAIFLPDGASRSVMVGEEKGIDVRIALDVVRMAHKGEFDVALIFSQDQDLSEVAAEIRIIAQEQARWIKIASAFPLSPTSRNRRGINRTDWIPIDRATYEACLDPRDYRPKQPRG